MKACWYEHTGPARDVLKIGTMGDPLPGAGEVLVELRASGINPSDTKQRAGWRGFRTKFPQVIPHADGAGTIVAVGDGVSPSRLRTKVWLFNAVALYDGSRWQGTAASLCALPSEQAIELPAPMNEMEGACLGVPACTAHRAVYADGPVSGMTVLVQGGAGAVGHYAIQFAKLGGATVVATVSSEQKALHAKSAGADFVLNYRLDNVLALIQDLTKGQGVDRIVEVDLGANMTLDVQVVKANGHIASYSSTSVPEPVFPYYPLAFKGVTVRMVQGFNMPDLARRQAVEDIRRWSERDQLTHAIGATYPMKDIVQAHEALEGGSVLGNVVLDLA